jgi:hypothetical protein
MTAIDDRQIKESEAQLQNIRDSTDTGRVSEKKAWHILIRFGGGVGLSVDVTSCTSQDNAED